MAYYYAGTEREIRVGDRVIGRGVVDDRCLDNLRGTVSHISTRSDELYVAEVKFIDRSEWCGYFTWWVYTDSIIPEDIVAGWSADSCQRCGKKITKDMYLGARLFKDAGICDDCVAKAVGKIQSYHFGKSLNYTYAKDKITMGVEIEIDDPDDNGSCENTIADVIKYARDNKYALIMTHEGDGSLDNNGFETVTAPLTLDDWKSDEVRGQINKLFESAEENGFDLWHDYSNAGLHVHIGRKDLCGTDRTMSDAVGLLMGWAVTRLWNKGFEELSRRRNLEYCHLLKGENGLYDTDACGSRYSAVNICNKNTIELRIFAGARSLDDVLVAVDMCYMLAKWATKKINAFRKRKSYTVKAGKLDDALEYADRLNWSALVKYSKFPEVTLKAMRDAGIVF